MLSRRGRGCYLLGSVLLVAAGLVPVKMLPFDNKNDFLVLVDMPEGSTLEATDKAVVELEAYLSSLNEVRDVESYVGVASPIDFNGMVRQYYLRRGSNVADLRVNLLDKHERSFQSHPLVLRIRPEIKKISDRYGANVKIVEVPPGPPVFSTVVAEVYGPPTASYNDLIAQARKVRTVMEATANVVDVDDSSQAEQVQYNFVVDRTKAGLHGITEEDVARSARIFLGGDSPTIVHSDTERTPLEINLRLPRNLRSRPEDMGGIRVKAGGGSMVPFNELGELRETVVDQTIFRKNLERLVFVTGRWPDAAP